MGSQLKIALPKGRLLAQTAELLEKAGWGLADYHEKTRSYRLKSQRFPGLMIKVFQEKDIPIQVAVGNYDLGICGLDWVEELLAKYPSSAVIRVADLGYGDGALYVAGGPDAVADTGELKAREDIIRIASEYPNLAELYAQRLRLKHFAIYPLWGAAEAYPPESADLVLLSGTGEELISRGLVPVDKMVKFRALLIANKNSLKSKDMAEILASTTCRLPSSVIHSKQVDVTELPVIAKPMMAKRVNQDVVRLALPDGHQQAHVGHILEQAGIQVEGYPSANGNRRPASSLDGVTIKVIRPQDMPLQVASGNFDLAITGRDWLTEHKHQFPSSPVKELLDLKYGRVRVVAVVSQDVPVESIDGLRRLYSQSEVPCRVTSEYINIADHYVRSNRFSRYRVIPTWGASEAFLPEDADFLIENTETGGTIARHNLKIIDTLFESTACLIGSTSTASSLVKSRRMEYIVGLFKKAAGSM